jgi:hypothetical protein
MGSRVFAAHLMRVRRGLEESICTPNICTVVRPSVVTSVDECGGSIESSTTGTVRQKEPSAYGNYATKQNSKTHLSCDMAKKARGNLATKMLQATDCMVAQTSSMEMRQAESWLTVCRQMSGGLAGAKPGTLCPIAG